MFSIRICSEQSEGLNRPEDGINGLLDHEGICLWNFHDVRTAIGRCQGPWVAGGLQRVIGRKLSKPFNVAVDSLYQFIL